MNNGLTVSYMKSGALSVTNATIKISELQNFTSLLQ